MAKESKWGYVDKAGTYVIPPQFGFAGPFSEGLALVTTAPADDYWKKTTQFGYIDRTGHFVIQARFNWARPFSNGLAVVCEGPCRNQDLAYRRVGYIDRTGKYVLPANFADGSSFSEDRAWVNAQPYDLLKLTRWSLIDPSGALLTKTEYFLAHEFSEGLAATKDGFVDRSGKLIIPEKPVSDQFSDGLARVLKGGDVVFVDTTGRVILRPPHQETGDFSEGLAPACDSDCGPSGYGPNWGYMDKTGKFVIPPRFGYMPGPFREGLAVVCVGCSD